jgi:hypothetical protein
VSIAWSGESYSPMRNGGSAYRTGALCMATYVLAPDLFGKVTYLH